MYVVDLLSKRRDNRRIDRSKGQGGRREWLNSFYSANNPSFATRYGFDDRSKSRMFKICTNSRIHNSQHSANHSSQDGTVSDLMTVQGQATVVFVLTVAAQQTVAESTIVVCWGIVAGLMIVSILQIIQLLQIVCSLLIVLRIYNYGRRGVYGIGSAGAEQALRILSRRSASSADGSSIQ